MALSTDQLSDLQADIGIGSDESVFDDDELNRLFARADSDYNLAVFYAIRQLSQNAARFHDYTRGDDADKKQQVFANLEKMYAKWQTETGGGAPLVVGSFERDLIEPFSATEYSSA